MNIPVIEVRIWGQRVGAVAPDPRLGCYVFAYDPAWRRSGIELAPLTMPLDDPRSSFSFPNWPKAAYKRLPGLLADALPDDFGNALIDAWMSAKRRRKARHHHPRPPGLHGPAWHGRPRIQARAWRAPRERRTRWP
jgi:hypothetical protein